MRPYSHQCKRRRRKEQFGHLRLLRFSFLRLRVSLSELRDIPSNLAEVLLGVVDEKLIHDEGCRFESPPGVHARGLNREVGIAQAAQRFDGSLHQPANVGDTPSSLFAAVPVTAASRAVSV